LRNDKQIVVFRGIEMNMWIYIALVVVIVVYVLLSRVANKKKRGIAPERERSSGSQHEPDANYAYGEATGTDLQMWVFYLGKALIYTFVMVGHAFKGFINIMKGFLGWYKGKKEVKVKEVPKNHLWCPRCQNYFPKSHICFRGAR
jgi:hypothetical protein